MPEYKLEVLEPPDERLRHRRIIQAADDDEQSGALMNFMMALPLIRMWRWVVMFCTRASASSVSE